MKVVVVRAFPDPYRMSMERYANDVVRRVGRIMDVGESIDSVAMPTPRLRSGPGRYWDQYVRYERYAREHAGDVNHIVDNGYGHLTSSLPPWRTVVTFHDAVVSKLPGVGWRTRLAFRYSLRAMRRAAAIICASETSRRDLLELIRVPEERLFVIPVGIHEDFRPAPDRDAVRRRLNLSGPVVLMVGHTQTYMNVERMLRAFAALVTTRQVPARLVKIGTPFTPAQVQLLSDLGISDRVEVVGRVAFTDLAAYFQAADVLFYAPRLAGFGLPPLEAMACGTPVVCSDRGAVPEVVGDAALMVDADDEGALAGALMTALTDAVKRRRLIEAGFGRASRFEWTESARRFLDVYRAVARSAGSRAPNVG